MPVLNVVIWYQVKVAHKKTFKKDIMAAVIVSFFAPGSRFHAKKERKVLQNGKIDSETAAFCRGIPDRPECNTGSDQGGVLRKNGKRAGKSELNKT